MCVAKLSRVWHAIRHTNTHAMHICICMYVCVHVSFFHPRRAPPALTYFCITLYALFIVVAAALSFFIFLHETLAEQLSA